MDKTILIGVEDFKKMREKYYFVDKTDFIRQLIDAHSKATLITRTRRFRKPLAMSMRDYFFSIDRKKDRLNLFHGLAIERSRNRLHNASGTVSGCICIIKKYPRSHME